MERTLADLLSAIPNDSGRDEVLQLGRQVHEVVREERSARTTAEEQQLLEKLTDRIRWHFRAARYAVPGPEELRAMIDDHFR